MPFDAAGFPDRGKAPHPSPPPSLPSDNLVTAIIVVLAVGLLATPISLGALADMVRYVQGA